MIGCGPNTPFLRGVEEEIVCSRCSAIQYKPYRSYSAAKKTSLHGTCNCAERFFDVHKTGRSVTLVILKDSIGMLSKYALFHGVT